MNKKSEPTSYNLATAIQCAVVAVFPELKIDVGEIQLEHPTEETHGDYSSNLALKLSKQLKQNPLIIAEKIAEVIKKNLPEYLEKVEVVKPGFLNFFLSSNFLIEKAEEIIKEKENYGKSSITEKKNIMVEFAHPNTHKQFHLGHLRNVTTGESIIRILETVGHKIFRTNYQGDVGMHVAKAIYGILKLKEMHEKIKKSDTREKVAFLGKAYILGNKEFEDNDLAKKDIVAINKKIYQKDASILEVWQETRQWSLDYFQLIYDRVYTTFDRLYFESEVADRGKELVLKSVGKVFEESDGAIIFPGEKFGLHNRVFVNSEGNPTYEGKDMGLGELQFKEYHPDLLIHNLGPEQLGYTSVMFEALYQLFPETRGKEMHLPYGWVKLKQGKMSSRTGNVVLGESLLDDIKKKIENKYPKRISETEPIAIGAAKYSLLKVGRNQEIAFDVDESINLQGNSGPYLQYTHARAVSVLKKQVFSSKYLLSSVKLKPEELSLLRKLSKFPEVVLSAAQSYSPNLICNYLFDLAQKFNYFYDKLPILKADESSRVVRLKIVEATAVVLKNGLYLLGIQAPDRM